MKREELLQRADAAMYTVKGDPKQSVAFFPAGDAQTTAASSRGPQRAAPIRRRAAVSSSHYQPVVALGSRRLVGFEALVRWAHPDGRLLPPGAFIHEAEQSGLIVDIGGQVLARSCAEAASWSAQLPSAPAPQLLHVNLSPRQLSAPTIVDDVGDALAQAGVGPVRPGP